ncbi:MAG TPA: LLM class flavin-dependent oxidoreductase [Acidimicrobiales bacterium]|nr:LLM class flavin-dependent oxidoreductase [Acidimicrobiales bacterium]
MRLGILLPTFRTSPRDALDAAEDAARHGLDGVFAYDHLWPMGSPERPAIAPFEVLAAVAERQPSLVVGPLVARVGLVGNETLLGQCRALRMVASDRVVIALGTGDRLSRAENLAYGVPLAPPDERRAALREVAASLDGEGVEVWIGDGAPATRAIASELGCTLNLWDADPEVVGRAAATAAVSWAGPPPLRDDAVDEAATAALLAALAAVGSTWAVFAPQLPIELLARLRG